jgi:hypothetical protein
MVLPAANMASASRSLPMICSGVCRFFGIESLLALPGLLGLSYHMDQVLGSRCFRSAWKVTSSISRAPGLPPTNAHGFPHGEPRGQRARGSKCGLRSAG